MLSTYRKAIAQFLTGLVTWATAVTVSPESAITAGEWVVLLGAGVGSFLVWLVPNQPYINPSRDELGQFAPKEAGQVNVYGIVIAVIIVIVLLLVLGVLP